MLAGLFRWQVKQGNQAISFRIASELGDAVRLDTAVDRIAQSPNGVAVCSGRQVVRAELAIVTVPISRTAQIEFDPPVTEPLRASNDIAAGGGSLAVATLPPGYSDCHNLVVGGAPLWTAWRSGEQVRGFAPCPSAGADDATLRADLAAAFHLEAADFTSFDVFRWYGPYLTGPNVIYKPGDLLRLGPFLSSSHGLVLFAGADRGTGGMEGAVVSGESAARKALLMLTR